MVSTFKNKKRMTLGAARVYLGVCGSDIDFHENTVAVVVDVDTMIYYEVLANGRLSIFFGNDFREYSADQEAELVAWLNSQEKAWGFE